MRLSAARVDSGQEKSALVACRPAKDAQSTLFRMGGGFLSLSFSFHSFHGQFGRVRSNDFRFDVFPKNEGEKIPRRTKLLDRISAEFSKGKGKLGGKAPFAKGESSFGRLITTTIAWKEGGDWVKVGLNGSSIRDLDNYRFDTLLESQFAYKENGSLFGPEETRPRNVSPGLIASQRPSLLLLLLMAFRWDERTFRWKKKKNGNWNYWIDST